MAGLKTVTFSGLMPRVSESLLPESHASSAQNCDFAYGELRGVKGDFMVQAMTNAAKSIYTDDGIRFYSWLEDVDAARSPLANDTFNRLYYTTPADFRVTSRDGMAPGGGQPKSSYRVGVPRPQAAPVLVVADGAALDDITITTTFQYEYSGVKYQEQAADLAVIKFNDSWRLTVPAREDSTPEQAFPVLRMVGKASSGAEVFAIYSLNSALAVAGNWSLTLSGGDQAGEYTATLAYTPDQAAQETRAIVYTYVNTYGEEGPPSAPATISGPEGVAVKVTVTRDAQLADYAPIKEIRVYRTPIGSSIADYFYSTSVSVLTQSGDTFDVTDDTDAAQLNEPLASDNWYPPDPALVGLMSLPNGILCARKGNELHFSEAYKPWAWPPAYVKTYKHALVGGMVTGSGALVTTLTESFFLSGVSPDSMTESKTGLAQGGLNKWAMADVGNMLVYASNDGLVTVQGGNASLAASSQFFTRDVWRQRYSTGFASMRFAVWDGRLIVYSASGAFTPCMIRVDEAAGSMTELPNFAASCSFTSPVSDQCYFMQGALLYQFAGGTELPARWASREIVTPHPINLGVAQIVCEGAWSARFYAVEKVAGVDAFALKHTQVLTGSETFRLPAGFLADRWKISLSGTGRMREIRVAETVDELKRL